MVTSGTVIDEFDSRCFLFFFFKMRRRPSDGGRLEMVTLNQSPHNQDTNKHQLHVAHISAIGHHLRMCEPSTRNSARVLIHDHGGKLETATNGCEEGQPCGLNHTKQATHAHQPNRPSPWNARMQKQAAHIVTSECVWGGMS